MPLSTTVGFRLRGLTAAGIIEAAGAGAEPGLRIAGLFKPRSSARLAR